MKKLVVFYSFEGNTRMMAKEIADEVGADLMELKPQKEVSSRGFMKYFWGGRQAVMREKPELEPLAQNAREYDLIFLGTPVWAFTFSPPLRSFLNEVHLSGKKVALFCCDEGGLGKTFVHLREALAGNEILGELELKNPLRKNTAESTRRVREWAHQITNMS